MTKKSGLRLAKRLDEVGFSDIVQIRNKVLDLRASGKPVHAFHGGEPFFDTPETIKYAMMKALVENKTRYAPSSGIEPLRTALAKKLQTKNQIDATAADVIVTAGGAHALHVAFQAVLNPGDDVLLFSPYWTPIRDMVTGAEARRAAGADSNGAQKRANQNAGAVFDAAYTSDLLQHAAESRRHGVFARGGGRGRGLREAT